MSDSLYPTYPALALVAAVVVLIPLPWHFQAWNSGTCLYMIWTAIACLNYAVNTIVWRDTALDIAPVWCDISSRIIVAVAVAIPSASLCINRRLYKIATMKILNVSRAERLRGIIFDMLIGLGIPLLQIVMQYIVSGHRFDIYENIGCYPFTYNTWLAYPLSVVWPLVIGLISAVYCVLSLRAFARHRIQFTALLSANASLTPNRYFRLMALASVEVLCTTPIAAYGMYLNLASSPLNPWVNWANVHFHYWQVDQYPAVIWQADNQNIVAFQLSLWAPIFCAFVFFAFFGFACEARSNYYKAIQVLRTILASGFHALRSNQKFLDIEALRSGAQTQHSMPVFVSRPLKSTVDVVDTKDDYTLAGSSLDDKFHEVASNNSFCPSLSMHSTSS